MTDRKKLAAEASREQFERYFVGTRHSKGVHKRETMLDRLEDDTYTQDHTQRHWWTWQNAIRALGVIEPVRQCERAVIDAALTWYETGRGQDDAAHELAMAVLRLNAATNPKDTTA